MRTLGVERINGHEERMCSRSEGRTGDGRERPGAGVDRLPRSVVSAGTMQTAAVVVLQETFRQVNTATLA